MAKLKINNINVPLPEDRRLVFSKAAYSIDDWLTKDIGISERISLPETKLLNSIFNRPQNPDIIAQKFSKYNTFKYLEVGKIVYSGVVLLLEFSDNEYEFQLIDSSFELFENLNDNLSRLELDNYDFIFNATEYSNLKALSSNIWLWSIDSRHETKTSAKIPPTTLAFSRPYFSGKRLVELMFSSNGWTYELSNGASFFDELIISANNKFVFTSYEKIFSGTFSSGALILTTPDFLNSDVLATNTITLAYNSKFRFRGNCDADNDFILGFSSTNQTQTFVLNKGEFDYDYTSNEFAAGDVVTITLTGSGNIELDNVLIYTIIDENDFGNISLANFTDFKVKTYDNIPKIIQKDQFKHCLVSIGGFFTTDNFRKKLNINSFSDISKLGVIDWSNKYVEDIIRAYPVLNYGKTNYFNYDNDDTKPINLGRGAFTIDNETITKAVDVYNSIFAASPEVDISGDTMVDNTVYDDVERINDINPLIAYYENVKDYTVARFEKLNGNNILSNYYTNFVNAIKKGVIFDVRISMNRSDYFLFDFTKLAYIKQLKSTFFVLSISDYSEGELTEVTLLKY